MGTVWRFRFIFNFLKIFWLLNGSGVKCYKKFKLLKYEHIIYSFEARDLEILNMQLFSRNIEIFPILWTL